MVYIYNGVNSFINTSNQEQDNIYYLILIDQ